MAKKYKDLGIYSDLVAAAQKSHKLFPPARPGKAMQKFVLETLAFNPPAAAPSQVRVDERWERDGVEGQAISWSVGYGPRTEAWLLRPVGSQGKKLPGVVALHDHGGFKYLGKEKIAAGPRPSQLQIDWVSRCYGGRFFADELAKRGFAVLVPDCFVWGSRKFPIDSMPEWDRGVGKHMHEKTPMPSNPPALMPPEISRHSWASIFHEHTVQKYCHTLGTSMGGIIAYEDRLAARYLATRKDVLPGGVGCVGLSGGGLRSGLLQATCHDIRAAVVVGLMSTYEGLLDHNIICHTWMLFPSPSLARRCDWADLTSCRAPSPMMVQYDEEDALFSPEGMKAAHRRIAANYKSAGKPKNYVGKFYPGPHKFDVPMQEDAFAWLAGHLLK